MVQVQQGGNGPAMHDRAAAVVFYGAGSLSGGAPGVRLAKIWDSLPTMVW